MKRKMLFIAFALFVGAMLASLGCYKFDDGFDTSDLFSKKVEVSGTVVKYSTQHPIEGIAVKHSHSGYAHVLTFTDSLGYFSSVVELELFGSHYLVFSDTSSSDKLEGYINGRYSAPLEVKMNRGDSVFVYRVEIL